MTLKIRTSKIVSKMKTSSRKSTANLSDKTNDNDKSSQDSGPISKKKIIFIINLSFTNIFCEH